MEDTEALVQIDPSGEFFRKKYTGELTADDAARFLPEGYREKLGTFSGASTDALEATVSLHGGIQRLNLALAGIIEYTEPPTERGVPRDFRWTELGNDVIRLVGNRERQEMSNLVCDEVCNDIVASDDPRFKVELAQMLARGAGDERAITLISETIAGTNESTSGYEVDVLTKSYHIDVLTTYPTTEHLNEAWAVANSMDSDDPFRARDLLKIAKASEGVLSEQALTAALKTANKVEKETKDTSGWALWGFDIARVYMYAGSVTQRPDMYQKAVDALYDKQLGTSFMGESFSHEVIKELERVGENEELAGALVETAIAFYEASDYCREARGVLNLIPHVLPQEKIRLLETLKNTKKVFFRSNADYVRFLDYATEERLYSPRQLLKEHGRAQKHRQKNEQYPHLGDRPNVAWEMVRLGYDNDSIVDEAWFGVRSKGVEGLTDEQKQVALQRMNQYFERRSVVEKPLGLMAKICQSIEGEDAKLNASIQLLYAGDNSMLSEVKDHMIMKKPWRNRIDNGFVSKYFDSSGLDKSVENFLEAIQPNV